MENHQVNRVVNFLTGEVGICRPDSALSRIPTSVIYSWINMFADANTHLRVTRTWFDPADEDNTLMGHR